MEKIYKPFVMFEFNNTKYSIIAVNGLLRFFKYIGTSLSENLTADEIKFISEVYSKIKINKKTSFPIKTINLNEKVFEIWYDLTSTLHFWYEIKDGNRCKSSSEDNAILNLKYNHSPDIVYTTLQDERDRLWQQYQEVIEHLDRTERNNKKNKIVNKICNIAMVVCACVITCRVCGDILEFSDLPIAKQYRDTVRHYEQLEFENEYTDAVEELKEKLSSQEYKWENIRQAIESNKKLGQGEKELLLKLKFYFDENHEYMDEFKDDDGLITKFGTGYSRIMPPEYCLLELLPQEDIKIYQFNRDERIIITALKEIESQGREFEPYSKEEKKIYARAVNLIDTYNCFYDENYNIVLSSAVDDALYQQLDEYYKMKNGISMREICSADIMYSDYDEMKSRNAFDERNTALQKTIGIASDEIDRESEIFYSYHLHVIPRTYFSDNHPYPIITYRYINQEVRKVEITDDVDVLFQEICDEYNVDVSKDYSTYRQPETLPTDPTNCIETEVEHSGESDYTSGEDR